MRNEKLAMNNERNTERTTGIDEEQRRADMNHVMQRAAELTATLPSWCARQRRIRRVVMSILLLLLPTTLFLVLPQNETTLVACNMAGGEQQVVECAHNLISIT